MASQIVVFRYSCCAPVQFFMMFVQYVPQSSGCVVLSFVVTRAGSTVASSKPSTALHADIAEIDTANTVIISRRIFPLRITVVTNALRREDRCHSTRSARRGRRSTIFRQVGSLRVVR